jgi:hypothetical protein
MRCDAMRCDAMRCYARRSSAKPAEAAPEELPPRRAAKREEPPPLFECLVARALSEGHWREEWATLTRTHVTFARPGSKRGARLRVALADIHEASA